MSACWASGSGSAGATSWALPALASMAVLDLPARGVRVQMQMRAVRDIAHVHPIDQAIMFCVTYTQQHEQHQAPC
jgi:hypothetical protein